ncbi:MAG: PEP-CTERM sorting domain-containing protein [Verrucomicrobia bacterium]|nr:PEP-CTERM sorting domain-containing protein [Verrucomicrobiota bacterium]
MNKKTLLLSGLLALAATPLLIAQNVTDIFIFGNDSISGGQKVEISQTSAYGSNKWKGNKTNVSVELKNQSASLNTNGPITIKSSDWNESGASAKAFFEATGKSSKNDFSGITKGVYSYGSGQGSGPQLQFTGFEKGEKYEVVFLISTPSLGVSNPNLTITDVSGSGLSVACFYGLLSGAEFTKGEGKTITLSGLGNQYAVKYSFTAGERSTFGLSFTGAQGGASSIPTFDIGLIAISAVPEPSAFGLLAGLSSVALVASRRRRRR